MILTKGYVDGTTGTLPPEWNHAAVLVLRCRTVPPPPPHPQSAEAKRF